METHSWQSWRCAISCQPALKISLMQLLVRDLLGQRPKSFQISGLLSLVRCDRRWDHVFGKYRRWCAVNHGVGVLHTNAVCSHVRFHDIHDGIVGIALRPITLPLQKGGQCSHGFCSSLNHSLHSVVVTKLANISTAVFNDEYFVAVVK